MPIAVQCVRCGKVVQVPDQYAGRQGRCKGCGEVLTVPGGSAPPELVEPVPVPAPAARPKSAPAPEIEGEDDDAAGGGPGWAGRALLLAGAAALVLGAGFFLLRPAWMKARQRAMAAVAAREAGQAPPGAFAQAPPGAFAQAPSPDGGVFVRESAPAPPMPEAMPPMPAVALGAPGGDLPELDPDPSVHAFEHFVRELIVSSREVRRIVDGLHTPDDARRVEREVRRLAALLQGASARMRALPPLTPEQDARLKRKYDAIGGLEGEAAGRALQRFEQLLAAREAATREEFPTIPGMMPGAVRTGPIDPLIDIVPAGLRPGPGQIGLFLMEDASLAAEHVDLRIMDLIRQCGDLASLTKGRWGGRTIYTFRTSAVPEEVARRVDFGRVTRIEGRRIEVGPRPSGPGLMGGYPAIAGGVAPPGETPYGMPLPGGPPPPPRDAPQSGMGMTNPDGSPIGMGMMPTPGAPPMGLDGAPAIPDGFLFRPRIETTRGTVDGGTAFAARVPGEDRIVILTALHLFGPATGLQEQVPAVDLPQAYRRGKLTGLFDPGREVDAGGRVLAMPEAEPFGEPSKVGDVVALLAQPRAALSPLSLSTMPPLPGERVWLAAQLIEGAPRDRRLHPALSQGVDDDGDFVFTFDDPNTAVRAASGAPIVNARGEVVAILAAAATVDGRRIGLGTPTARFLAPLKQAMARARAKKR